MIALLALACTGAPPPTPEPASSPKPIVSKPFPVVTAAPAPEGEPAPSGGPVPIELQFEGVGDLHQRYFGDTEIVTPLATALGDCMKGRAVVRVSYDQERRIGRIRIYTDRDSLTCVPSRVGEGVDLRPLEPIGRALAAYRDTVAGRFDYRVASFKIDLEALHGTQLCRLQLGGQFPPDGSTWSACAVLGGEQVCAGDADDGVRQLVFPDAARNRYLLGCFR